MSEGDPKEEDIPPPPDTDPEGEVVEEVDETDLSSSIPVPPQTFTSKFCILCGVERRPGANFCHGCGAPYDDAE
ncbi:MAG: hypothetical protein ABIP39_13940 [Polyangiaceae bacterium]